MIYPINHLPESITIGVQTENDVEVVGFDLRAWMNEWEDISVTVWPTRPGEDASYPATDTEMIGTVLYWYPNQADTAISGTGKVELLGLTADKRKLSGWCKTLVQCSSLANTQNPPEAAKPWVDQVLEASKKAQNAVKELYGAANVHVGSDLPPENAEVWIDPSAEVLPDDLVGHGAVRYDTVQELTTEQKAQARHNLGLILLRIGEGLEIVDGVLRVTGTVTPPNPDVPQMVAFVEQEDGTVLVQAVGFVEQEDGSILWDGAVFTQQDDGSYRVSGKE